MGDSRQSRFIGVAPGALRVLGKKNGGGRVGVQWYNIPSNI